jgi:hypothetical protein
MSEYAKNDGGQQMRMTEDELNLIKATYGGNERLLKLLRKVFLPDYDPMAPFGQTIDLWLAATDLKTLPPDIAYQHILARNMVIGHVEAQIEQLRYFAELKKPTAEEQAVKNKLDSTQ